MTAPTAFSVVPLLSADQELPMPTSGPYFIATKSGYMAFQPTHWGYALTPTKEHPTLAETQPMLYHDIALPGNLIGQAWAFFRAVYEQRRSEAMVDITWSREKGYRLFVPRQQTTGTTVDAKRNPDHYRGQIVGTIHSHCNFNAFHSGTDKHDAGGQDGLHMTIGHVLDDKLDIALMITTGKTTYDLELSDVTSDPISLQPFPRWWLSLVSDPKPTASTPKPRPAHRSSIIVSGSAPNQPAAPTTPNKPVWLDPNRWSSIDALLFDLEHGSTEYDEVEILAQTIDWIEKQLSDLGYHLDYEVTREGISESLANRLLQYQEFYE